MIAERGKIPPRDNADLHRGLNVAPPLATNSQKRLPNVLSSLDREYRVRKESLSNRQHRTSPVDSKFRVLR
jgi:hypothetical protein